MLMKSQDGGSKFLGNFGNVTNGHGVIPKDLTLYQALYKGLHRRARLGCQIPLRATGCVM